MLLYESNNKYKLGVNDLINVLNVLKIDPGNRMAKVLYHNWSKWLVKVSLISYRLCPLINKGSIHCLADHKFVCYVLMSAYHIGIFLFHLFFGL